MKKHSELRIEQRGGGEQSCASEDAGSEARTRGSLKREEDPGLYRREVEVIRKEGPQRVEVHRGKEREEDSTTKQVPMGRCNLSEKGRCDSPF